MYVTSTIPQRLPVALGVFHKSRSRHVYFIFQHQAFAPRICTARIRHHNSSIIDGQPNMASNTSLGPLIRMRPLPVSQLPSHPKLSSHQSNASDIHTFARDALQEAQTFMTAYMPSRFTTKSTEKRSEPAKAPISLLAHEIKASDLPREIGDALQDSNGPGGTTENWFARVSLHDNKEEQGTASWDELDFALRVDHSQHEKDYTPDVMDAHQVLDYSSELSLHGNRVEGGWEDVTASVMQMRHHIPPPLQNRVFTVLVITAKRRHEFITVQIPVETRHLPGTKYEGDGKVTMGMYVSVERGDLVEEERKTRWEMATASDAGGRLPMWAQKLGTPGAVVKDVGLVVKWLADRRKG